MFTSQRHSSLTGILPQKCLLFFPGSILWTGRRCGYGVPAKPHRCQSLHGVFWAKKALKFFPTPPNYGSVMWMTLWLSKGKKINKSFQHFNSVDLANRFTVEDNKEDGDIPIFDTIVKPEADGKLSITVYRKCTHTDQYLQWGSHHHLLAKYSLIDTPTHGQNSL